MTALGRWQIQTAIAPDRRRPGAMAVSRLAPSGRL